MTVRQAKTHILPTFLAIAWLKTSDRCRRCPIDISVVHLNTLTINQTNHCTFIFLQTITSSFACTWQNEPPHDKSTKWHLRPAETQISLGIRPFWSESSLSTRRKLGSLATIERTAKILIRLGGCPSWSESSMGAQPHFWFCHEVA